MADEQDIVFKAGVDGASSLNDLKKLYKEQQIELSKTEKGTADYERALRRLGSVKDEMVDLRDTINALNPEGKVAAFSNVAGKLAGGFQAATGAAALFGTKSEELEKTLLRVQAATAFAEGITSIAGLSDSFAILGTVIKTQVVSAFSTLKGAILATGIGALAVAIGVLIAKTIEYNEKIEEEYDKQRKLNEELKKTTDEYLKQAVASEELRNRRAGGINELERELKILEASGAKSEEIAKKRKEIIEAEIFNLKVRRSTIEGDAKAEAEITEQILTKQTESQAITLQYEKQKRDEYLKTAEEKKRLAEESARKAAEAEAYWNEVSRQTESEISEAEAQKAKDDYLKAQEELNTARQAEIDSQRYWQEISDQIDEESRQARKQKDLESIEEKKQYEANKVKIEDTSLRAAGELSKAYFQFQLNSARGNAAEELKVKKKAFEVNKAFALAGAAIDGVRGVQNALLVQPYPVGLALSIAQGALALGQIAQIAGTRFEPGNTSANSISTPNISANTISAPNISAPTQVSTRLNSDGTPIDQPKPAPIIVEARVVEQQMTDKQKSAAKIQSQSRF